jgi:hypothetical protein
LKENIMGMDIRIRDEKKTVLENIGLSSSFNQPLRDVGLGNGLWAFQGVTGQRAAQMMGPKWKQLRTTMDKDALNQLRRFIRTCQKHPDAELFVF